LIFHRSRRFWSVRRNAVPSSSAERRRTDGAVRERLVLARQDRDDRLDDAVERRSEFPRHLFDEVVLELLDLPEFLVVSQELDILRKERFGEFEHFLAVVVGTLGALRLYQSRFRGLELLAEAGVIEKQRERRRFALYGFRQVGLDRIGGAHRHRAVASIFQGQRNDDQTAFAAFLQRRESAESLLSSGGDHVANGGHQCRGGVPGGLGHGETGSGSKPRGVFRRTIFRCGHEDQRDAATGSLGNPGRTRPQVSRKLLLAGRISPKIGQRAQ